MWLKKCELLDQCPLSAITSNWCSGTSFSLKWQWLLNVKTCNYLQEREMLSATDNHT